MGGRSLYPEREQTGQMFPEKMKPEAESLDWICQLRSVLCYSTGVCFPVGSR